MIIAVVLIYTKFFGKTVIDLNKYYTITVTGVNGDGELDIVFEEDKFREKYQNVLKYDEKQVRKEVEKEYGDEGEDYIDLAMESLESYEPVELAIESLGDYFFDASEFYELNNGQKITFTYSEENLQQLEAFFDCKIKTLDSYTVEGLKDEASNDAVADASALEGEKGSGVAEAEKKEPTATPEPTTTPEPTATPEPTTTPEPTATPEPTKAVIPTATPSLAPTATPTPIPVETAAVAEEENTALCSDFYKDGQITGTSKDYIIPDSMDRYLTYDDISNLTAKGLSFARNEMMARLGRGFKNQELADYFASMSWYQCTVSPEDFDSTVQLSDIVQANADLMLTEEKKMGMYIL